MVETNKPSIFTISYESCTHFQTLVQKIVKKTLEHESILYNSTELSVDCTSSKDFQN